LIQPGFAPTTTPVVPAACRDDACMEPSSNVDSGDDEHDDAQWRLVAVHRFATSDGDTLRTANARRHHIPRRDAE
jgi:hypothetical protein